MSTESQAGNMATQLATGTAYVPRHRPVPPTPCSSPSFSGRQACNALPAAKCFFGRPQLLTVAYSRPHAGRRQGLSVQCAARKVALLGAAGGIGQPLALLLKMQPLIGELALYDIANTVGVAADLSHCNTPVQVHRQRDNCVTAASSALS